MDKHNAAHGTRRGIVLSAAGLTGAALAACGAQPGAQNLPMVTSGPITVRAFLGGIDAIAAERWNAEIAEPFTRTRSNVTLQLVPQSAEIGGIKTGGTLGVVEKLVKLLVRVLETHVPQVNVSSHPGTDDLLRVLNPAMTDLLAGKEAPVPLLQRLRPELQVIANQ